jgi:alpha-galactosidase
VRTIDLLVATILGAAALAPDAGRLVAAEQWTLATNDTRLTIGLDAQNNPTIVKLENPAQQFNWAQQPSPLPVLSSVVRDGQTVATNWQFLNATVDNSNGTKLTLHYTSTATGLQMTSQWWARPGAGPIHQSSTMTNSGVSPVTIASQPTLALQVTAPQTATFHAWHFATDGGNKAMDPQGVYRETITAGFSRTLRTDPSVFNGKIPLAVLDSGGSQGLYVGTEWSYGDIKISNPTSNPSTATIQSGNVLDFQTTLAAGQAFQVPPGFVGTYKGNIDAAGNSLRKYLYRYNMPAVIRNDATYPKVQWNAFAATGKAPKSWDSVESKYSPLVNAIAPLGFEEVMLDVGWWSGSEPNADPQDWPSGMKAAADYAHTHGMRFGLYWTDNKDMTVQADRQARAARVKRLLGEHGADVWRSDDTSGPLVAANYWSVKGFYDMVDQLQQEVPNFQWENCQSGGRIKDYGAMKRSVTIFNSDNYSELDVRKVFYDSSFAFHPMQLLGHLGTLQDSLEPLRPQGAVGMRYAFRSMSMGAPEWLIDSPDGGNGGAPWTEAERQAVAACVATYKTKLRPLVRSADLYHIFPRPDGQAWDGIEYYDPSTSKGAVYIFKPDSTEDTHTIVLQVLDAQRLYNLTFEDGFNPALRMSGADLMGRGIAVTLHGTNVSELMFIEAPEPSSLAMVTMGLSGMLACVWARRGTGHRTVVSRH